MFEKIKNWINLANKKEIVRLENKINSLERQLNNSTRIMIGDYCGYPYDMHSISIATGLFMLLKHQGLELKATVGSVELVNKKIIASAEIVKTKKSKS